MNRPADAHPPEEDLLRLADGELASRDAVSVQSHLESCWHCRSRMAEIEAGIADFVRHEEMVMRPLLPEPPRPWMDLTPRLDAFDRASGIRRPRAFPSMRWPIAAAAAVFLALVLARMFERVPSVNAAELLQKASAAELAAPASPRKRIRIRTRSRDFTRPASMQKTPNEWQDLAALFAQANYSWDNPLSVDAYRAWRDQLPEKQDVVTTPPESAGFDRVYLIHTTTSSNVLTSATLTLRVRDLHAVNETLEFRGGETADLSEVNDDAPETSSAKPANAEPTRPPSTSATAGPGEELQLAAALHRIGADLGEPVEVSREGNRLVVRAMGLGPRREDQLRSAVTSIPGVDLRFDEPHRMTSAPEVPVPQHRSSSGSVSPLRLQLQERLGDPASAEAATNQILDASETAMARAYALRALARRFGPPLERQLGPADVSTLAAIRADHLKVLTARVREMERQLWPALENLGVTRERLPHNTVLPWQSETQQIFDSMTRVDQMLTTFLASSETAGNSQNWNDLAAALNRLDTLLPGQ